MEVKCPECGSKDIGRDSNGEVICNECGFVIEEGFVSGNVVL